MTPTPPLFEQEVAESNSLRAEQAAEYDTYIALMKSDRVRRDALFTPNYSSVKAYEESTKRLRERFAQTIGYPPPGKPGPEQASFTQIGEDALGVYYRAQIPVLPGIRAEGIYIVPKNARGKVPLIISMHGGGGSPEVALFKGGANYHDMVRGGVKNGYAVFAPQHLFKAPGHPDDIRQRTDNRLRLVGTSLTAIEILKITRSLDLLLTRPEIDPKRVAMVGLSYGGYYSLVTPAMDSRIKVIVSSCYFGVQEYRYERDELAVGTDFRFADRFTLFRDSEIAALICPRPILIQAGARDADTHRVMGAILAPQVAEHYSRLGKKDAFEFLIFDGGHEFHDASAWEFVKKHL